MKGPVHYEYSCLQSQVGSRISAYGYNTGWQDAGGVISLDRQHVWCPDWYFLNSFSGATTWNWGTKFTYNFVCSNYPVSDYTCGDYYTRWNDPGSSIIYLDRHDVYCADGMALKGFEGQTQSCGWWCSQFRYHFKCCSSNSFNPSPSPIANPSPQPISKPTQTPTLSPIAFPVRNK